MDLAETIRSLEQRWPSCSERRRIVAFLHHAHARATKTADDPLLALVRDAVAAVGRAAPESSEELAAALPLARHCLEHGTPALVERSGEILLRAIDRDVDPAPLLPLLLRMLRRRKRDLPYLAARLITRLVEEDALGPDAELLDALEAALGHPHLWVRRAASCALTLLYPHPPPQVDPSVAREVERMPPGYWRVSANPFRCLARTDTPLGPTPDDPYRDLHRRCAVCTAREIDLLYIHSDCGTGWRQYFYEYRCRRCGMYTVYHFDD